MNKKIHNYYVMAYIIRIIKDLLDNKQPGVHPGNCYLHHLLSATNEIRKVFDTNPLQEALGVFLNRSKAFD